MATGNKNKKIKRRKFSKFITFILISVLVILFGTLFYLNVIPLVFLIIILTLVVLLTSLVVILNFNRKRIIRLSGYLCSLIISSGIIFIEFYLFNTLGFLFNATNQDFDLKTYNILVLNDSKYEDIDDLDGKSIGFSNLTMDDTLENAQNDINEKIDSEFKEASDTTELLKDLKENSVDGIILENNELDLLKENEVNEYNKLKNIYQIETKNKITNVKEALNINKESFNVYISGIDTFGSINATSRSDVNILVTVNPVKEKVLITWIPRDYYVNINEESEKDKLTHAGIYGIDSSIYAIQKLLNVDINYYVKVNFTSVIKIVDALKGIIVYNDERFISEDNYLFKKGEITLNGKEALSFVRERHHVTGGDLGRGKNQIKVLEALINKAKSKEIITSYNKLLNSMNGAFATNASQNVMFGFVKREIQSPRNWQIESLVLNGVDSYEYTYSYQKNKLYVMIPNEEEVINAQNKIKDLMSDK